LLIAVALGGCSFKAGSGATPDAGDGDGDGDAGDGDSDAGADGMVTAGPICDPTEPNLGACWKFDENFLDSSGNDHLAIPFGSPTFATDGFEGPALSLDGDTDFLEVAETQDLDNGSITMEVRIRPAGLPADEQEAGIFDNQGQWSLLLVDDSGQVRCNGAGGPQIDSPSGVVDVDQWSHVACSIDDQRIRLYVDGDEVACGLRSNPASVTGTQGSAIGADIINSTTVADLYDGLIDNLQIFEETRSPDTICAAAGRSGCIELADPDCR
jgi:hypothetical protein